MNKSWAVGVAVVLWALSSAGWALSGGEQLQLKDLRGRVFSLKEAAAKGPVVIDFWATWCKPCIKSLVKMQALAKKYRKQGVQVVTINIDGPRSQAKIRPFLKRHKLELPVLLDPTGETMQRFHLAGPPGALIFDQQAQLLYKHQGFRPGDEQKWDSVLNDLTSSDVQDTVGPELQESEK